MTIHKEDSIFHRKDCKVCTSLYRTEIEDLIKRDVSYQIICDTINERYFDLDDDKSLLFNKTNLSEHWNKHYQDPALKLAQEDIIKAKEDFIDIRKQTYELYDLWDEAKSILFDAVKQSDTDKVHHKIAGVNQLIKTKMGLIELTGKLDGQLKTKRKITKGAVDNILAEIKETVTK